MITKIMEYKEVRIGNSRVVIAPAVSVSDVNEARKVFCSEGLRMFSRKEAEDAILRYPKLKEELRGAYFDTSEGNSFSVDEDCSAAFKVIVRTDMACSKGNITD